MKKLAAIAALFLIFSLKAMSYAAEPREFISEKIPEEITKMVESAQVYVDHKQPISTAGTDIWDYGIVYFVTPEDYIRSMFEENYKPAIYAMSIFALTPVRDGQGNIVDYDDEFVGIVFNIENVRWFKNAKVKDVFEKATR